MNFLSSFFLLSTLFVHGLCASGNAFADGAKGSVTNSRQVMDTLNHQLKSHDGHASADVMTAYITGADSQIDNGIATVSEALAPLTGGASEEVGNQLLGPFAQSLTNGAEVLLSNMAGGAIDGTMAPAVSSYTKSLTRFSVLASKNKVDVSKLNKAITQLNSKVKHHEHANKHKH